MSRDTVPENASSTETEVSFERDSEKRRSYLDSPEAVENGQPAETPWKPSREIFATLVTLCLISIVVALDATILVPALPTIAEKLHGSTNEMFWAGTSYLLTSSTSQPILAAVSDMFGRRSILLISIALFTLGTLVIVLAHNFPILLAGRGIQGVGGGGIQALNLVIMTDLVPLRQRPKYTAPIQLGWAFGTIVGPLIGGAFAKTGQWKWVSELYGPLAHQPLTVIEIFYINFPFCVIGFIMVWFFVRASSKTLSMRDALRSVDWVGSLLFMGSTTSFLIGLTWAGTQYKWVSVQVLVPMCVGGLGIFLTGVWEWKFAAHPFIRRSFLQSWSTMNALFITMIQGMMLYAGLYYLSLFLLSVMGKNPIMTGVSLLPISCGLLPAAVVSGFIITKLGKYRWSVWFGWAVGTLGAGLLGLLDRESPIQQWFFIFMILGVSHGCLITGHNFAVQASVNQSEISQATGLFSFFRSFGLCLGVAIPQAIFLSRLGSEVVSHGFDNNLLSSADAVLKYVIHLDQNSPAFSIILDILTKSFHFLFYVIAAISGAALLLSFFLGRHTLDRGFPTTETMRPESTGGAASHEYGPIDGVSGLDSQENTKPETHVTSLAPTNPAQAADASPSLSRQAKSVMLEDRASTPQSQKPPSVCSEPPKYTSNPTSLLPVAPSVGASKSSESSNGGPAGSASISMEPDSTSANDNTKRLTSTPSTPKPPSKALSFSEIPDSALPGLLPESESERDAQR